MAGVILSEKGHKLCKCWGNSLFVKFDRDKADEGNVGERSNQFQYNCCGVLLFVSLKLKRPFISLWHQIMKVLWDYLSLLYVCAIKLKNYHMFFWSSFFGSFGQLAVQAAQFLAVSGRQVCVGILGSNFLGGQGM